MQQWRVTIKINRLGIGAEYKVNIVTAETIRRALDKLENKIMTPLRTAGQGKQVVYQITEISLIERGVSHADDN